MSGPNYWVLIRIILPTLLLSVALKYPTMAYSNIFAGTGAFSSVAILSMYLLRLLERLNKSIYDSTVALAIICILCLYFAYISAGEAVGWITELRIKQKDLDTDEGMDKMTKEFIKFLSSRTTFLMVLVLFFSIFVLVLFIDTLLDILYWNNMYKDEIFDNAVLIGFDARQGYLFLIAEDDNTDVYYWDDGYTFEESDDEQNVYFLGKDFSMFDIQK